MRINEYESFEKFYDEYNYERDIFNEHYTGIEFIYNHKMFRLSRDYDDDEKRVRYFTWQIELDETGEDPVIVKENGFPSYVLTRLKIYENLDDALDNWYIDGVKFREVIMDDNTIISSKDWLKSFDNRKLIIFLNINEIKKIPQIVWKFI